jgi:hypothetical protein
MQPKTTSLSPEESQLLLRDPDRLYARWRQALTEHHHLHGPEAAALLGVPEAALLASATGRGNQPLQVGLAKLLEPLAQWGRVLVAVRNRLGVKLDILARAQIDVATTSGITIQGEQHHVFLSTQGVARIDLFEEEDGHGHTFSLNWFDGRGDVIGRLFLMSKSGREEALPWLQQFAVASPQAFWEAAPMALPPKVNVMAPQWLVGEPVAQGAQVQAWATAAILCCDQAPAMQLDMSGMGAASVYRGALGKTMHTPPGAHATDLLCKLHARPQCAVAVRAITQGEVMGLQVLDADGGSLVFMPQGLDKPQAWLDAVAHRAQALAVDSLAKEMP